MSFSASRLTLYAILSSIEEDLRRLIDVHLADNLAPKELFGDEVWQRAKERMERDLGVGDEEPVIGDLLAYADFSDSYHILNKNSSFLPQALAKYLRAITSDLERLVPIRNRVAHSRPLNFDDLAIALDAAENFTKSNEPIWSCVSDTLAKLKEEASFVLGLEIPAYETDPASDRHNLPIPDFDETGFLGRKQQVDDLIKLCYGPYPVITIVGEGGLGKTALAMKVAYDLLDREDCPFDAIVWTSSKTAQLTSQEIVKIEGAICDSLGMMVDVAQNLGGASAERNPIEEVLGYLAEFKILLILDNLETVLDDRIRKFLERLPSGSKVLITSRIGLGAFEYPVKLQAMAEPDSVQLLRALAKVRNTPQLGKQPNGQLAIFCRRMKNNPGYIKWFVSAVQTGRRPEEVLDNPQMFLEFCMSNVYNYLAENSRRVLRAMLCLPGRHSQAELGFLTEMETIDLQKAVQQLLTTNMVSMTSIPRGSSFESQYDVSDLARAYLAKHHPVEPAEFRNYTKKRAQLVAAGEQIAAEQRSDPYSVYSLAMRSRSDLIVAKYLLDALNRSKRNDYHGAEELVARARNLAPEYFEVHRVDAWVKVKQRNMPAARTAYEAAIELEGQSAPLHLWYAGFLMRYMADVEAALVHLKEAAKIDPLAQDIELEMARAYLYLKRFDESKSCIESLLARNDLTAWKRRKVHDLHLQLFRRWAEHAIAHHDSVGALDYLDQLKDAYDSCPSVMVDSQMKDELDEAMTLVRTCLRVVSDDGSRARADRLNHWLSQELNDREPMATDRSNGRAKGSVLRLMKDKNFGFLGTDDNQEVFFHRGSLRNTNEWATVEQFGKANFVVGTSRGRVCAFDVVLEPKR